MVLEEIRVATTSKAALSILISLLSQEYSFESYKDIALTINNRFKVNITEDDIVDYFAIDIEEEDRQLTYKHFLGI